MSSSHHSREPARGPHMEQRRHEVASVEPTPLVVQSMVHRRVRRTASTAVHGLTASVTTANAAAVPSTLILPVAAVAGLTGVTVRHIRRTRPQAGFSQRGTTTPATREGADGLFSASSLVLTRQARSGRRAVAGTSHRCHGCRHSGTRLATHSMVAGVNAGATPRRAPFRRSRLRPLLTPEAAPHGPTCRGSTRR